LFGIGCETIQVSRGQLAERQPLDDELGNASGMAIAPD
jgi:hypothetical protein